MSKKKGKILGWLGSVTSPRSSSSASKCFEPKNGFNRSQSEPTLPKNWRIKNFRSFKPFSKPNVTKTSNKKPKKIQTNNKNKKKKRRSRTLQLNDLESKSLLLKPTNPIFGVTLEELDQRQNKSGKAPQVILDLIKEIGKRGYNQVGLFRVPGSTLQIEYLEKEIDLKGNYDFATETNINNLAGLLKSFLRKLSNPLFTFKLFEKWETTNDIDEIKELVLQLPDINGSVLIILIKLCKKINQFSQINKMNSTNLAKVIGPNLSRSINNQIGYKSIRAFEKMILNYDEIFSELEKKQLKNNNLKEKKKSNRGIYFDKNDLEFLQKQIQNSQNDDFQQEKWKNFEKNFKISPKVKFKNPKQRTKNRQNRIFILESNSSLDEKFSETESSIEIKNNKNTKTTISNDLTEF
ncbi:rho/rac/cdc gtpase-activating protein [Anaeramoeba flamelloides]|uniref:Rho/rac/cdc gtpase-activating protein n=1 Tax=Anaeramoeba flamelloides TaxID=1746091 RepID=A0ABQ8YNS0_9EUKA|nr:rho/rac/cdc gtpase-activating protein [Anaeramoeba flamelloides]